jgi:photosystem II stability/assembly factor-like uncharacterized protein
MKKFGIIAFIFLFTFVNVSDVFAATWTERTGSGSRSWKSITSSSDGTKLAAVVDGGYIYTSTDSGATWTERTGSGSRSWTSITSSSDGTKLAAVAFSGYIYTSTDSGATWTEQTNPGQSFWQSITSSSDGTKLVAGIAFGGAMYISTNSGSTWTEQVTAPLTGDWTSITSSSDGTKLAASNNGGYITISSNSGSTWTEQTGAGQRQWKSITSSSDGTKLAAVVYGGYIYTSTDSGATWSTNSNSSGSRDWWSITSSSDGTKLAAGVDGGYIYTSTDSGANWTQETSAGSRNWQSITSSSDGTKLAAGNNYFTGGYIYTSAVDTTAPTITSVSSDKTNGQYTVGEVIDIDVTFSEAVTSTGNVTVTLETGTTDRTCTFTVSNASTGTCNYTVQATDTTSDLTVSSISGTIADQAANSMVSYTIATNLAANKALIIDTTAPSVSITAPTEGATVSGAEVSITANASDTNTIVGVQFKRATNTAIGSEDTTSTYGVTWDTTLLEDGAQSLIAVARDTAGNYATSTAINVSILNTVHSSGATGQSTEINASCKVSDTTIKTGDEIDIEMDIEVTAGGSSAPYSFKWIKILTGSDKETSHTFDTEGEYIIKGQVKTDYADKTITCDTVTVSGKSSSSSSSSSTENDSDEEDSDTEETTTTPSFSDIISKYKDFLLTLRSVGVVFSPEVESVLNGDSSSSSNSSTSVRDLEHGMRGDDVKSLQELLISQGYSIPAGPTGYFVDQTRDALIEYQIKNSITPAIGYFGASTRTQMKGAGLVVWW